jgi:hypothetical protein
MGMLDNPTFCTLFVAVDNYYLDKMLHTYPTWLVCHPELISMPHAFVYDETQVKADDPRWEKVEEINHKYAEKYGKQDAEISLIPWVQPEAQSQRERMLTGLIRSAKHIETPWYLKLDADTFANNKTGFYYDKWFKSNPCYISNPWGYTKPGDALDKLNKWAEKIPELRGSPIVTGNVVDMGNGKTKVQHPRMASWVMFGNTAWTKWASDLCTDPCLPFPSQDTYLSYIQARTGKNWESAKFRHYGWEHCKNLDGLIAGCKNTLEKFDV